jgi:RNA polymerase sigma factor (sigma-70 family)
MSADFNAELVARHLRGDRVASEELVRRNMGMVAKIARRYHSDNLSREDLLQEGVAGLLDAARYFDPARGYKFSTFACWRVLGAVTEAVQSGLTTNEARRAFWALGRARRALFRRGVLNPSVEAVAELTGIDRRGVEAAMTKVAGAESLDAPSGREDESVHDVMRDERATSPEAAAELSSDEAAVRRALASLSLRERTVIRARFYSDPRKTLSEIAGCLGVTRQRAYQIERRALDRLRVRLFREVA